VVKHGLKIKPCPHCGATTEELDEKKKLGVSVFWDAPTSDEIPVQNVTCLSCGSRSPSVSVWNQRINKRKK